MRPDGRIDGPRDVTQARVTIDIYRRGNRRRAVVERSGRDAGLISVDGAFFIVERRAVRRVQPMQGPVLVDDDMQPPFRVLGEVRMHLRQNRRTRREHHGEQCDERAEEPESAHDPRIMRGGSRDRQTGQTSGSPGALDGVTTRTDEFNCLSENWCW